MGPSGGADAFQAHVLSSHGTDDAEFKDVKKEDILDE